jgi:hypothetical protein
MVGAPVVCADVRGLLMEALFFSGTPLCTRPTVMETGPVVLTLTKGFEDGAILRRSERMDLRGQALLIHSAVARVSWELGVAAVLTASQAFSDVCAFMSVHAVVVVVGWTGPSMVSAVEVLCSMSLGQAPGRLDVSPSLATATKAARKALKKRMLIDSAGCESVWRMLLNMCLRACVCFC